jgi:hypothetical protein
MRRLTRTLALLLAACGALAACGTLPEPFYGNPGKTGAVLAMPPPPELVVLPPRDAALPPKAATQFADSLSAALVANDIPSIATPTPVPQWRLRITETTANGTVTPAYAIIGPNHKTYGTLDGQAVPLANWQAGDPTALNATAQADAPKLATLLAAINAKVQGGNPDSLENRTPRVFIGTVTGAPGDGDSALPLDLARALPDTGVVLTKKQQGADFAVTANVKTQPQPNGTLLVELDWILHDANNRVIGQVTQLHALMPTDIEPYWGDVAAAAAQQAAGGIREAISHAVLKPTSGTTAEPKK